MAKKKPSFRPFENEQMEKLARFVDRIFDSIRKEAEKDPSVIEKYRLQLRQDAQEGIITISFSTGRLEVIYPRENDDVSRYRPLQDRVAIAAFEAHLHRQPTSFEEARDHILNAPFCAACILWIKQYKKVADPSLVFEPRKKNQ